jgi:hypothetical protein
MTLSMNQQYKAAKTDMPFKEWIEWKKSLERKSENFFNSDGNAQSTKDKMRKQVLMVTVPLAVIGLGLVVYGLMSEK